MNIKGHKIVFLFSGQGSQYRGMGKSLYESNLVFRNSLIKSETIIRKQLGRSLIEELYTIDERTFDDVLITHPAIVSLEIAMIEVMESLGITPDYVSGSSLGEFAAGVASGVWDAEAAIEASIEQSKSMNRNYKEGGMLVVFHEDHEVIEIDYRHYDLFLASDNFNAHFTLSGSVQNLDAYQYGLSRFGLGCVRLPVKIPFHSSLISQNIIDFDYYMANNSPLSHPKSGFVSGIEGKEIDYLSEKYFGNAVSKYVNFPKIVSFLESKGNCFYLDLGPSGTSSTFVKYNLSPMSKSQTFQIITPFGMASEQIDKLKKMF